MIPSPWVGLVLALAAYRVARLIGWDELPPIVRARAWVTGEYEVQANGRDTTVPRYRRPLLHHWIECAFCQGTWVAVATYGLWLAWPRPTLYGAAPLALAAAVGLIARNLD